MHTKRIGLLHQDVVVHVRFRKFLCNRNECIQQAIFASNPWLRVLPFAYMHNAKFILYFPPNYRLRRRVP